MLEPTSPLRVSEDIDIALENLNHNRKNADSIVSVSKVESTHPVFNIRINSNGLIEPYVGNDFIIMRRQEIEPLYFFEGSIYISDIKTLLDKKSFYHKRTMSVEVPRWKSIEIDEMVDLVCTEAIIRNSKLFSDEKILD